MAGQSDVTTATKDNLNEVLVNSFDASTVLQELNAQVHITRDFRNESFKVINDYTYTRQADLRQKIKNLDANASLEDKKAIYDEIYRLQYQKRLAESLVGVLSGMPNPAITQTSLQIAATKMRHISLENSLQSPGLVITDADGNTRVISNVSESSGYFDGVKLGGTRLSTDVVCGDGNKRCETDDQGKLILNADGHYTYTGDDDHPTYESLKNDKKEFKAQIGATGGAQTGEGTLFGFKYAPESVIDMVIESFAGTHDLTGGQMWGWYGDDGNTSTDRSKLENIGSTVTTTIAIPVSTPLALADLMTPDFYAILMQLAN